MRKSRVSDSGVTYDPDKVFGSVWFPSSSVFRGKTTRLSDHPFFLFFYSFVMCPSTTVHGTSFCFSPAKTLTDFRKSLVDCVTRLTRSTSLTVRVSGTPVLPEVQTHKSDLRTKIQT